MKRKIEKELLKWMVRKNRKVLLIRGARQVGKTHLIREFGKKFSDFVEINFDLHKKVHPFFDGDLDPVTIVKDLELYIGKKIIPGKTLLFFDEIQACKNAISSLRYFYELMPDLHLIAAGSLLEFTLSEIPSFGVGRVESMFLFPLSFEEYLLELNGPDMVEMIKNASFNKPVNTVIHEKLIDQLKIYQIIGGLPEVVQSYIDNRDLLDCQRMINVLIQGYYTDFIKYKDRSPVARLKETIESVAKQTTSKFKYSNIGSDSSNMYKESLEMLLKAGLVYKAYHTNASGNPLGSGVNPKFFKAVMFDTGVYQRLMNLNLSDYVTTDFNTIINRGQLTEIFAGSEIKKMKDPYSIDNLYYWHRESKSSQAEVDYVIEKNGKIIPVEVKAASGRKMKSMHLFMEEKKSDFGIRLCADNFSKEGKIYSIPLYAAGFINDYEWLV